MESGPHPGPAGAMRKLCTQEEGPLENHAVPFSAAFAASWPGRERLHVTILFLQGRSQVPRDEKHQVGIRSLFASMGAHPYWSGVLRGRTKNLKASYLVSPFQPACTHPPFLSPLISGQRSDRNTRKQATALPSSHPFDAVPLPPAPPPAITHIAFVHQLIQQVFRKGLLCARRGCTGSAYRLEGRKPVITQPHK